MKGIFFCEFVEMVEETQSPELMDSIILESELATEGAYTAGGNYDYRELLQLFSKLSDKTGLSDEELMHRFGEYLFERLCVNYPEFFEGSATTFSFLSKIEDHIHTEVCKIYPDSEMARFETHEPDEHTLVMTREPAEAVI